MDRNHSLVFLGLNTNAIVDEDGTGDFSRAGKKLIFIGIRSDFVEPRIMNLSLQTQKADSLRFAPHREKLVY